MRSTGTVSGIARERVDDWLAAHVPGARPPFEYSLITGGRSNLTYAIADGAGQRYVLRRPPLGHVLESAHDMGREHRIISALARTAVPVPRPLGFCADPAVSAAPFYVMDFVDGVVLADDDAARRHLDEAARAHAGPALVDVLAELHAVDPAAVGLGDLGRPDGYVERQLRRWHGQIEKARAREIPAMDEVHRRLAANVPAQQRTAIVHGDYRLGNCLLAPDGAVRAVLDWELCTLGDPLADLGWLIAYWIEPGEDGDHLRGHLPTMVPGFVRRSELIERYAARTGASVDQLDFYVALAYWKLACIAEGVYARYRAGVMADEDADLQAFESQVPRLAEAALEMCTEMEG